MNMSLPTDEAVSQMLDLPQKDVEQFLLPLRKIVFQCSAVLLYPGRGSFEFDLTNFTSVRAPPNTLKERNVCYTIFTLVGRPDADPELVRSMGFIRLVFDTRLKEYPLNIPEISIQIGFHDNHGLHNPYIYGLTVYPKKEYTIVLKKVVKIRLPEPYETKCVDYLKKWKENGGYGPLTETDCMEGCLLNASLEVMKCIPDGVIYPSNEAYCSDKVVSQEVLTVSRECAKQCGPACREDIYDIHSQAGEFGLTLCEGDHNAPSLAATWLKFENMETTTYSFKPKFEVIEIFGYVGGYVGIWLGISLVAVFDFVETLVMLAKYPLTEIMLSQVRRKKRKTRITRINLF